MSATFACGQRSRCVLVQNRRLLPTLMTLKILISRIRVDTDAVPAAFSSAFQYRSERLERQA